jgi:hypothetical protein
MEQPTINASDRAGARACWKAAVCLEANYAALTTIKLELDQEFSGVGGTLFGCEARDVLVSLIDGVKELVYTAAQELDRMNGCDYPFLLP